MADADVLQMQCNAKKNTKMGKMQMHFLCKFQINCSPHCAQFVKARDLANSELSLGAIIAPVLAAAAAAA